VEAFLAYIKEVLQRVQSDTLSKIRAVSEFEDIFQYISNLPPERS